MIELAMVRLFNTVNRIRRISRETGLTPLEFARLRRMSRYVPTTTQLFGKEFVLVDACTFLEGLDEIFVERIYDFPTDKQRPLIIDAGANIGLATLFFKRRYPACRIVAFEPDKAIFDVLRHNVGSYGFSNIELHNAAIWCSEGLMAFQPEGAYSGRLTNAADGSDVVRVKTFRLRNLLNERVDFLKVDIEGAEGPVIVDCADRLNNVSQLFVEYHSHVAEPQVLHDILSILSDSGLRYHIKEAHTSTRPLTERELLLGMDLQLNVFAFRE